MSVNVAANCRAWTAARAMQMDMWTPVVSMQCQQARNTKAMVAQPLRYKQHRRSHAVQLCAEPNLEPLLPNTVSDVKQLVSHPDAYLSSLSWTAGKQCHKSVSMTLACSNMMEYFACKQQHQKNAIMQCLDSRYSKFSFSYNNALGIASKAQPEYLHLCQTGFDWGIWGEAWAPWPCLLLAKLHYSSSLHLMLFWHCLA